MGTSLPEPELPPGDLRRAAFLRRSFLAAGVVLPTLAGIALLADTLPHGGRDALEILILFLFAVLFAWLWIGFWTASFGLYALLAGDRFRITRLNAPPDGHDTPLTSTAVIMPICNEDADEVFARLRATYLSVRDTGQLEHFDFYILSDSYSPEKWVEEELAWARLCREVDGFERIHYRRRRYRVKKKSGNVVDFLRRWGDRHEYMIVLDADSVMAGSTLVTLVQAMQRNPRVGIIQTLPYTAGMGSLYARMQQFANRLYAPMFAAGLAFWWLGDGQYWGHNVIIRTRPFMTFCGLPKLGGKGPFAGEILSHDFVEAALIHRGGWQVWVAPDLDGSWEAVPPTLTDDLKRDRRWCQGNLQHARIMKAPGLHGMQRFLLFNGIMAYVNALLWGLLLAATTLAALRPLPEGAMTDLDQALRLFMVTLVLLFVPKLMSLGLALGDGERARLFGGRLRLSVSVLLETLLSALMAPVRMVFHSRFVIQTLMNRKVAWGTQQRGERDMRWSEAARDYGGVTALGVVWAAVAWWADPVFFAWLSPVLAGLWLAIPMVALTSRGRLGQAAREAGIFLTPDETRPGPELLDLWSIQRHYASIAPAPEAGDAFVRAAVDPNINALHLGFTRRRHAPAATAAHRAALVSKALQNGPESLSSAERGELLNDFDSMQALHEKVWALDEARLPPGWRVPPLHHSD